MKNDWETRRIGAIAAVCCMIGVLALNLGGCNADQLAAYQQTKAELASALDSAQTQLAAADALKVQLDAQIEALPDGEEKTQAIAARQTIEQTIETSKVVVARLQEGVAQAQQAIDAYLAGDSAAAVQLIGPYVAGKVPAPWGLWILLGTNVISGILAFIKNRQAKQVIEDANEIAAAAKSVILAIEEEKSADGTVAFGDAATAASLRSRMSTEARDLVEQVRQNISNGDTAITPPLSA